jgi:NAD(P)-dependent dehydrogenase (short-subunit alcohol dehydrogenase family)
MKTPIAMIRSLLVALALALPALFTTAAGAEPDGATSTVLITGSNRGIGLALARSYAERGWTVYATARKPADSAELQQLAKQYSNVRLETLDVADHASIDALAAKLRDQPIDVLLHNAGISGGVPAQAFGRMKYDVFREVLEVNTVGPMKLTEALIGNVLASAQKKVVLIGTSEASFAGINAGRLYWYRSSKAAAHMLMLNLAYELKARSVIVGVINPGPVDTDLMKGVRMPLQPPAVASSKILGIIDRLTLDLTGRFWNYEGGEIAW